MPRVRRFQTYDFTKSSYLNVKHNVIQRSASSARPAHIMKTEMPKFLGGNTTIGAGGSPMTLNTDGVKSLFRDAVPYLPDPVDPSVEHLHSSGLPIPQASINTFYKEDLGLTEVELDTKLLDIKSDSILVNGENTSIDDKELGDPGLSLVSNYDMLPWLLSYQSTDLRELPSNFDAGIIASDYYSVASTIDTFADLTVSIRGNTNTAILVKFSNTSTIDFVTYADDNNYFTIHFGGSTTYASGNSDYRMYSEFTGVLATSNADESDGVTLPYPTVTEMNAIFDFTTTPADITDLSIDFNTDLVSLSTVEYNMLSLAFNLVKHANLNENTTGYITCSGTNLENYVQYKKEQIDTLYAKDYETALEEVKNTPFGKYLDARGGLEDILSLNISNASNLYYSFRLPIQNNENLYRDEDEAPDPRAFEEMLDALGLHDVIIPYGEVKTTADGVDPYIKIQGYALDWEKLAKLPPLTFMTVMVTFSGLIEAQYPKPKTSWFSIILAVVLTIISFGALAEISIYLAYAAVASTIFYVVGSITGNEKLLKIAEYIGYVMIVFSVSQGVQKISTMQGLQYAVKIASYVQNMKYEAAMKKLESEMAYLKKVENEMSEMMNEIEQTEKVKEFIYGEHINVTHTETFNYDHLYTYF